MSWQDCNAPDCEEQAPGTATSLILRPKSKDIGGFSVRRALPSRERRTVGPFIFFDEMGPADLPPGVGIQVRPHPHIGIATITYLFRGEIVHRDSLGYTQPIRPGAVNLMTAGRGIVHSERAGEDLDQHSHLHGIQSWMALPEDEQEREPAFVHYPEDQIPTFREGGVEISLIMGSAYGHTSPVTTYSPTLYMDCRLAKGSELALPTDCAEKAVYVVSGSVEVGETRSGDGVMVVLADNTLATVHANEASHIMVIGGAPIGKRLIWWNLVSTSQPRIDQAKQDWKAGRFTPVPGDDEYIPLPE